MQHNFFHQIVQSSNLYECVSLDIVFLRSWYPVSVPQLYNPVTSLLMPVGQKDTWGGMRTLGQLKYDLGIRNKPNQDSLYKVSLLPEMLSHQFVVIACCCTLHLQPCPWIPQPVVRQVRHFNPLHIPKELHKALPFKSKSKQMQAKGKTPRDLQRPAVIREPHEKKVRAVWLVHLFYICHAFVSFFYCHYTKTVLISTISLKLIHQRNLQSAGCEISYFFNPCPWQIPRQLAGQFLYQSPLKSSRLKDDTGGLCF